MVYIMNLRQNFGVPSDSYVHTVSEGYRNCRLDMSVLKDAIRQSVPRYADTISDRIINSIGYERQMSLFDFDIAEIDIEEDDDEDISDEMYAEDQEEDEDNEELDDENSFIPIQ